jgi:hypothetical protein
MTLKIKVGPALVTINRGHSLFVSAPDGQIRWPSRCGFFVWDTRIVSDWTIFANGEPWELLNSGAVTHFAAQAFLTNRAVATEEGEIAARTLLLQLGRSIAEGAIHEDIDITNHGRTGSIANRASFPYCTPKPTCHGPGRRVRCFFYYRR